MSAKGSDSLKKAINVYIAKKCLVGEEKDKHLEILTQLNIKVLSKFTESTDVLICDKVTNKEYQVSIVKNFNCTSFQKKISFFFAKITQI